MYENAAYRAQQHCVGFSCVQAAKYIRCRTYDSGRNSTRHVYTAYRVPGTRTPLARGSTRDNLQYVIIVWRPSETKLNYYRPVVGTRNNRSAFSPRLLPGRFRLIYTPAGALASDRPTNFYRV